MPQMGSAFGKHAIWGHQRIGIHKKAAGEPLHCDKPHVLALARRYEFRLARRGQIVEWKLHRLVQTGLDGLEGRPHLVRRDADMIDFALSLGFDHAFVHAGTVAELPHAVNTMELVEIDMVAAV